MGSRSWGTLVGALTTALRLVSLRSRPFGTLVGVWSPVTALRFACTVLLKSRPFGTLVGVGVLATALRLVLLRSRPFGTLVGVGVPGWDAGRGFGRRAAPRLVSLKSCFYVAWDTLASFINFKKKGLML